MPSRKAAHDFNASYKPTYIPVAIITGATAGIGKATAEALARHLQGRVHLILVGRNRAAAESIIASLPVAEPEQEGASSVSKYEFVQCDVTKMKNVHAMADEFKGRLPKVNFLIHCAGTSGLTAKWKDNGEGLDVVMASRYYARWALTYDLIPLLKEAHSKGESSSVLSILGAGFTSWWKLDATDIGLKKTHSGFKGMFQTCAYNDYMIAEFARREPDIAFTHAGPGFVATFKWATENWLSIPIRPLLWLTSTPVDDCAEYMLYGLLSSKNGGHLRNHRGNNINFEGDPRAEEVAKELWEHSMAATGTSSK